MNLQRSTCRYLTHSMAVRRLLLAAIFLIVEMYSPFDGLLKVSDAPFRTALGYLKQ